MLIALSGVLTGYDGNFPFEKPGDEFGDTNYIGMRMVSICVIVRFLYKEQYIQNNISFEVKTGNITVSLLGRDVILCWTLSCLSAMSKWI